VPHASSVIRRPHDRGRTGCGPASRVACGRLASRVATTWSARASTTPGGSMHGTGADSSWASGRASGRSRAGGARHLRLRSPDRTWPPQRRGAHALGRARVSGSRLTVTPRRSGVTPSSSRATYRVRPNGPATRADRSGS